MKNIIFTTLLSFIAIGLTAQVAIGKATVTNESSILEFDNAAANRKGIILSAVENVNSALSSSPLNNNGTFLFDKSDNRVKMYEKNAWVSLSDMPGNSTSIIANTTNEPTNQQGVIIGAATTQAKGILVLEAADKAMILPWIQNPHTTVKNPYPGMMCYDTASRTLAVFDGSVWNYWK